MLARLNIFLFFGLMINETCFADNKNDLELLGIIHSDVQLVKTKAVSNIEANILGLEIISIEPSSLLYKKGIREKDVILEVDGNHLTSQSSMPQFASQIVNSPYKPSILKVKRSKDTFYIIITGPEKTKLKKPKS